MVCSGDFLGSMLAYVGFMLAYVGFMLAYVGIMLAHAGFMLGQVGSCCLKLAPSWPQDAKNGSLEPPRGSKSLQNEPRWPQDGSKIDIFEVHFAIFPQFS